MQNTLKPRFRDPQMLIFAADHGIAVDGIQGPHRKQTQEIVHQLLTNQLPLAVFSAPSSSTSRSSTAASPRTWSPTTAC